MIDVPKTIKEYREFRHLTQRQLADKSGISRQTVWNVERENNGTTVYTFERLRREGFTYVGKCALSKKRITLIGISFSSEKRGRCVKIELVTHSNSRMAGFILS